MDTKWLMTTNEDIIYYDEVHVYETSFSRRKKSNVYIYMGMCMVCIQSLWFECLSYDDVHTCTNLIITFIT